jgi:glycosyltransferase involved in cell wall biosynthesis
MNSEKVALMRARIEEQIAKIDNKDFTFYFYVPDTKGVASGSLAYLYDVALGLQNMGYKVGMMYSEEDFIGVDEWLGKEYAELPHHNVEKSSIDITPSDILFIPEVYSNVMTATKKLPCQRVAVLQSFDKLVEFIPFGATWADLGITKAITTTEANANRLRTYFPFVTTGVVSPKLSNTFTKPDGMKKLMVNIVTREPGDVNKIVKPFFWQYPMYQWVAFRDLRGFPKEMYAQLLRESALTIWVDEETSFGYGALEAMKSGSIVMAKTTELAQKWMEQGDGVNLKNCCVWFDTFHESHRMIASVVRAWITDTIPTQIQEAVNESLNMYSYENTKESFITYINGVLDNRKSEMQSLITTIKNKG